MAIRMLHGLPGLAGGPDVRGLPSTGVAEDVTPSLRARTLVLLLVVLVLAAGAVAVAQLDRQLFPSIEAPALPATSAPLWTSQGSTDTPSPPEPG